MDYMPAVVLISLLQIGLVPQLTEKNKIQFDVDIRLMCKSQNITECQRRQQYYGNSGI